MGIAVQIIISVITLFFLTISRARLISWGIASAGLVLIWQGNAFRSLYVLDVDTFTLITLSPALIFIILSISRVRRSLISRPVYSIVRKILPKVSKTEQQALQAGTAGFDTELFSGRPDWDKLRRIPPITLTDEEQAFLDGPTEELCNILDDWKFRCREKEISKPIWDFVKKNGFLGMLISKRHGGLGFSAQAQSLILGKISSRSPDAVTIVMVPNSLGPGELIEKYGTPEQKEYYLNRLASGKEIPCFSLTSPTSGSDASNMRDYGIVEYGYHDGVETLGIRLNWNKRYITLGPEATLIGLAFQLFDPRGYLDRTDNIGITLAIIPAHHKGVMIGRRHLPCGAAFPNGPNWGKDVFIPIEWLIGGVNMAGQGWRMLMECLSVGRAVSLPSSSAAGIKTMLRYTSAYGRIRKQFGRPIAFMEGVEELLARTVENAYALEAARAVTCAMIDSGEKPSVISAIMKYQSTERLRQAVNDAMDLHGGKGICDGPSNYLQASYQMVPIGITVEGSNVLTRSLITFAQGALRSHPYLFKEIQAAQHENSRLGQLEFDKQFCNHVSFTLSNVFSAFFHNLTGGIFRHLSLGAENAKWYRQLSRLSLNFALVSDLTVCVLGERLKVKQKLTGRLSDTLSELYFMGCALKRFEDDGCLQEDFDVVELVLRNGLYRGEMALRDTINNFPLTPVRILLRWLVFPLGSRHLPASDNISHAVVRKVLEPGDFRNRMTRDIFISDDPNDQTGILEAALEKVVTARDAELKLHRAGIERLLFRNDWLKDAIKKDVLTEDEATLVREAETITANVIAVDHFDPAETKPNFITLGHNSQTQF
ncbi:MAG: Acyl-coenzyme A dehydrogenase [Hyphomicrobiaceae bacterium hypho_1]